MQLNALCRFHSSFRWRILQSQILSVARFPCLGQLVLDRKYGGIYNIEDAEVAGKVMKLVQEKQINKSSILIIANQGSNLNITNAALEAGFQDIIFTEKNSEDLKVHLKMAQKFPACRVQGRTLNLFDWTCINPGNEEHLQQEMSILGQYEQKQWHDDPPLTFFGIITPGSMVGSFFLRYLVNQLMTRRSFYTKGRVDWFLFLSPTNYKFLVKGKLDHDFKNYGHMSIMVNVLYDWKVLLKLPDVSFSPPICDVKFKKEELQFGSTVIKKSEIVFVQLTPKANLFQEELLKVDEISAFCLFLVQLLAKKHHRLIPRMEELVPGCGLELIKLGYTMITMVRDIQTPEEMIHLFKAIRNIPEYQASPLETLILHDEVDDLHPDDEALEGH
ncbi:hypothetical protein CHS0354_042611 [Potamilus streckersoni]|uniref:Dimethyladenosine transferase 2, mitochondrial n=1 Tax=Potamilus streckersoni TaxID=2493646 RepID=A0AAE0TEV1_9BIVA|nr:hypothetical protein CHS0354_042611 [Potamilus streckersoni]